MSLVTRRNVIRSFIAVCALSLFSASIFAADDKKEKKNMVSKELGKPLKEAQEAINQKKYSDALAKLKEADGNPKKTPWDQHIICELEGNAYAKTNNYAEASRVFEAELNDGFLDEKDPHVKGRSLHT